MHERSREVWVPNRPNRVMCYNINVVIVPSSTIIIVNSSKVLFASVKYLNVGMKIKT